MTPLTYIVAGVRTALDKCSLTNQVMTAFTMSPEYRRPPEGSAEVLSKPLKDSFPSVNPASDSGLWIYQGGFVAFSPGVDGNFEEAYTAILKGMHGYTEFTVRRAGG